MKRIIIGISLSIVLIAGIWWLFSSRVKPVATTGSSALLLIDAQTKSYTVTTYPGQPYDASYRVAGSMDQLSDKQFADLTAGLQFVSLGTSSIPGSVAQPLTSAQQGAWLAAIHTLSSKQQDLCASVPQSDSSLYCMVRHLVLNALAAKKTSAICEPVFIEDYKQECITNMTTLNMDSVPDANRNGLVDFFEHT